MQTRARVTLLAGWGKIQHNQRGDLVLSTKLPNSLHRVVLVLSPNLSPSPSPNNNNSSRVLACSGTLVRLGLKISHQVDSVSVAAIVCTFDLPWFREHWRLWGYHKYRIYRFVRADQHRAAASCFHYTVRAEPTSEQRFWWGAVW